MLTDMTPSAGQFYGSQIPTMGMNISHMQKPTVGAVSISLILFILYYFSLSYSYRIIMCYASGSNCSELHRVDLFVVQTVYKQFTDCYCTTIWLFDTYSYSKKDILIYSDSLLSGLFVRMNEKLLYCLLLYRWVFVVCVCSVHAFHQAQSMWISTCISHNIFQQQKETKNKKINRIKNKEIAQLKLIGLVCVPCKCKSNIVNTIIRIYLYTMYMHMHQNATQLWLIHKEFSKCLRSHSTYC